MLVRIPGHNIWADISFKYDKYIQADSEEELYYFVLRRARVVAIHSDEEIQLQVRKTIDTFKKDGLSTDQIVSEISGLYGIPEGCVEEMLAVVQ